MNYCADLVFDIGMHRGDDTAYYLHHGYGVVGIEANPSLAEHCRSRFAVEIRDKRLTVLNVGLLKQRGAFTFYRNLTDDGWSSFDRHKGTKGGRWDELEIPCLPTSELIALYGTPFFMKVDIEGADVRVCAR